MLSVQYPDISSRGGFSPKPADNVTPFPGNSLENCLAKSAIRRVAAKELIFAEGDPALHIYRIEAGAVSLFKVLSDGRRQILGFAYAGDFIGLGIEGEHVMNAQAIKPLRMRSMNRTALHAIAARDPGLSYKLYQAIAGELAAMRDLMMTTGHRSASERVAAFLMALSRRNRRNGEPAEFVDLPMTRADIADFLGLTIETVSRTLTKLKTRRLIDLPQSACVHLLDSGELQRLAQGDDGQ